MAASKHRYDRKTVPESTQVEAAVFLIISGKVGVLGFAQRLSVRVKLF